MFVGQHPQIRHAAGIIPGLPHEIIEMLRFNGSQRCILVYKLQKPPLGRFQNILAVHQLVSGQPVMRFELLLRELESQITQVVYADLLRRVGNSFFLHAGHLLIMSSVFKEEIGHVSKLTYLT